jgi:uncharacterized protein (TIGR03382 family)
LNSTTAGTISGVNGSALVPGAVLPSLFFADGAIAACAAAGTACSAGQSGSGAVSGGITVDPGQFGLYTGTGTVSSQLIYTAGRTPPSGTPGRASLTASVNGAWTGEWNLTYTYDEAAVAAEVPEPGTWAQGVVGLVGVAWLMRRRRSMR